MASATVPEFIASSGHVLANLEEHVVGKHVVVRLVIQSGHVVSPLEE